MVVLSASCLKDGSGCEWKVNTQGKIYTWLGSRTHTHTHTYTHIHTNTIFTCAEFLDVCFGRMLSLWAETHVEALRMGTPLDSDTHTHAGE
jgi:hypothetical protein